MFREASDDGLSVDLCAPVKITGIGQFTNAKLRAADVYAIVSVP